MPNSQAQGLAATVAANEAIQDLVDSSAEVSKMLAERPGMQPVHPFQVILNDIHDFGDGTYTNCMKCGKDPATSLVAREALCKTCVGTYYPTPPAA